jgi:hypothetical protein
MPLCDSSETCTRAVRPEPSPAVLRLTAPAGIPEVSRFSCMKFLGVLWGLRLRRTERELALTRLLMLPSAHYKDVGVRIASLRSSIPTPPILYLRFVGSLAVATQDSRPSGSLLLSREELSSSASCRLSRRTVTGTLKQREANQRFCCPTVAAVGLGFTLVLQGPFFPHGATKLIHFFLFCRCDWSRGEKNHLL